MRGGRHFFSLDGKVLPEKKGQKINWNENEIVSLSILYLSYPSVSRTTIKTEFGPKKLVNCVGFWKEFHDIFLNITHLPGLLLSESKKGWKKMNLAEKKSWKGHYMECICVGSVRRIPRRICASIIYRGFDVSPYPGLHIPDADRNHLQFPKPPKIYKKRLSW